MASLANDVTEARHLCSLHKPNHLNLKPALVPAISVTDGSCKYARAQTESPAKNRRDFFKEACLRNTTKGVDDDSIELPISQILFRIAAGYDVGVCELRARECACQSLFAPVRHDSK